MATKGADVDSKAESLLAASRRQDDEAFPFVHLLNARHSRRPILKRFKREPTHLSAIGKCLRDCRTGVLTSDWLYLTLLGLSMGAFSFAIDYGIQTLRAFHFYLLLDVGSVHPAVQYMVWILFTMTLILLATALCHYLSPQAAGAGIPEMKTILRGVVLKEYLTARTLVVKLIGLVMALSSGLPLGKEGPFVHIASILATLLGKFVVHFQRIYASKARNNEMLAAACAVGVASTYGAPVGGVLFSIEVTSVFFPLRNYWRGFFASVCSAITFRLLTVLILCKETVLPYSPTSFRYDFPFDVRELIVFALLGTVCGLCGALYILLFKRWTYMMKTPTIKKLLARCPFIYPTVVVLVIASLNCPTLLGRYFAGGLTPREALETLFCNFSWNELPSNDSTGAVRSLTRFWSYGQSSIYLVLCLYCVNMFWMTAISTTLPVPCGTFIPVFATGAAFGRLVGELMALAFPEGVSGTDITHTIIPGAYAVVGAAAFSGAVTHAVSTSVIVFEMTGQISYLLPTIIAVLLANAVCARFQASLYDTSIYIKRLPYLPRIPPTSSAIHAVYVHDIMVRDVRFITLDTTYRELLSLLKAFPKLRTFPLVDQAESMILLGSVRREELMKLLEQLIVEEMDKIEFSTKRRLKESHSASELKELNARKNGTAIHLLKKKSVSQESLALVTPHMQPHFHWYDFFKRRRNTALSRISELLSKPNLKRFQKPSTATEWLKEDVSEDPQFMMTRLYQWSKGQLEKTIDFDRFNIDPAPMQLVEKTSLYKVHVLFSLLGLNRAYVTNLGRLVGVVALRELRQALEDIKKRSKRESRSSDAVETLSKAPVGTNFRKVTIFQEKTRNISVNPAACLVPIQEENLQLR